MTEKNVTLTISLRHARTLLDCIDADMDLSTNERPDYQDIDEMAHYLRRAEARMMLKFALQDAAEEDVYVNACDDENCECRKSNVFPDNIRSGCAHKEGEDIYWSYSKPASEGL